MMPIQECEVKLLKVDIHKCQQCTKAFFKAEDLATHAKHHNEMLLAYALTSYVKLERIKILECDLCRRIFLKKRQLLLHRLEHVGNSVHHIGKDIYNNKDKVKPYKCPECDYAFVAKSTLEAHSVVHQPFEHICYCGIGYHTQLDLKRHQKLVQCKNPQVKDIKPTVHKDNRTNELINTEEEIKVKFPFKQKKKRANDVPTLKVEVKDRCNRKPKPPLDVDFELIDGNKYQCPECLKCYAAINNARKHYRQVHKGERPYTCQLCNKTFTQTASLNQHLIRHSGVKTHVCQYCGKSFATLQARLLHERTHTGYKPHKCSYCEKEFSDPSAYARHVNIHTGEKKYKCEICSKSFTHSSALFVHKKLHGPRTQNYKCNQCDKKFYIQCNLRKHISIVHNREYKVSCELCDKPFSHNNNLRSHINVYHNPNRQTYSCNLCFKLFKTRNNLKKHIKVIHEKIKEYTCEYCDRQFPYKCVLVRHLDVHANLRKYECDLCSYRCNMKSEITKHIIKRHIRIKCKLCSRYFACKNDFVKHKLKESEKCYICDKEFWCKKSLKYHLHLHIKTPNKYECDYCGDLFTNRNDIRKHILRYHMK